MEMNFGTFRGKEKEDEKRNPDIKRLASEFP